MWGLLGGLLAAGGLYGVAYFGTGHETKGPQDIALMVSASMIIALLGGYTTFWMFRARIILRPDAIEVRNAATPKALLRNEIAGWRIRPTRYIRTLEILPINPEKRKLKIGLAMSLDDEFYEWFKGIHKSEDAKPVRFL
jgi:hypothetical protein